VIDIISVGFCLNVKAAEPSWTIDKAHSRIGFSVSHMGLSTVDGRFTKYDGTVAADNDGRASAVSAVIQVQSINTDNEDRDNHLRSPELFDVKANPTITMKTETVDWKGDRLSGNAKLTIKGKTREVQYVGGRTGKKVVTDNGKETLRVGYTVSCEIDRSQFGLNFGTAAETFGLVGKTVTITINVEITRPL
jgi:polyisoprenoid-binding protein YceI